MNLVATEEDGNMKLRLDWSRSSVRTVSSHRWGLAKRAMVRSQSGPGAGVVLCKPVVFVDQD